MKSRNAAIYSAHLLLSRPLARRLLRVKIIIGRQGAGGGDNGTARSTEVGAARTATIFAIAASFLY
jgi:hypothetical protein